MMTTDPYGQWYHWDRSTKQNNNDDAGDVFDSDEYHKKCDRVVKQVKGFKKLCNEYPQPPIQELRLQRRSSASGMMQSSPYNERCDLSNLKWNKHLLSQMEKDLKNIPDTNTAKGKYEKRVTEYDIGLQKKAIGHPIIRRSSSETNLQQIADDAPRTLSIAEVQCDLTGYSLDDTLDDIATNSRTIAYSIQNVPGWKLGPGWAIQYHPDRTRDSSVGPTAATALSSTAAAITASTTGGSLTTTATVTTTTTADAGGSQTKACGATTLSFLRGVVASGMTIAVSSLRNVPRVSGRVSLPLPPPEDSRGVTLGELFPQGETVPKNVKLDPFNPLSNLIEDFEINLDDQYSVGKLHVGIESGIGCHPKLRDFSDEQMRRKSLASIRNKCQYIGPKNFHPAVLAFLLAFSDAFCGLKHQEGAVKNENFEKVPDDLFLELMVDAQGYLALQMPLCTISIYSSKERNRLMGEQTQRIAELEAQLAAEREGRSDAASSRG